VEEALKLLAGHGPLGIVCAIMIYAYWRKERTCAEREKELLDRAAKREHELVEAVARVQADRIADAKASAEVHLEITRAGIESENQLSTAVDALTSAVKAKKGL